MFTRFTRICAKVAISLREMKLRLAERDGYYLSRFLRRIHRDQQGTITILSVFAVLMLTLLLGMVLNAGRQADGKIRLQNSADAAAYSGAVVLARGMNTLAFTNHLLCDVFATTAFMREAASRYRTPDPNGLGNSERYVPRILSAWANVAPAFSASSFPKFAALGPAILQKIPLEQDLVTTYSAWAAASSERILPLMEEILAEELIPQYQRAVVAAFPDIAQAATMEVSLRNSEPENGRGKMLGVLWRSPGVPVGGDVEMYEPSLPVVDPVWDNVFNQDKYRKTARRQRKSLAERYLRDWNRQALYVFDHMAEMSRFGSLWRSFTCAHLKKLLEEEYPNSNLPMVIRTTADEVVDGNEHLDRHFTYVGVVYWGQVPDLSIPFKRGVFTSPIDGSAVAYAAVRVYIPRRRLIWWHSTWSGQQRIPLGGVPGEFPSLALGGTDEPTGGEGGGFWRVVRQSWPTHWDLLNQNWTCQLVPATQSDLSTILQAVPPLPAFAGQDVKPPDLGGLQSEDIARISPH